MLVIHRFFRLKFYLLYLHRVRKTAFNYTEYAIFFLFSFPAKILQVITRKTEISLSLEGSEGWTLKAQLPGVTFKQRIQYKVCLGAFPCLFGWQMALSLFSIFSFFHLLWMLGFFGRKKCMHLFKSRLNLATPLTFKLNLFFKKSVFRKKKVY